MLKAIFHQPWRSGWLGKLLRRHSVAEEDLGRCWCQTNIKSYQIALLRVALIRGLAEKELLDEKGDDITSKLIVIPFADDRPYTPKEQNTT